MYIFLIIYSNTKIWYSIQKNSFNIINTSFHSGIGNFQKIFKISFTKEDVQDMIKLIIYSNTKMIQKNSFNSALIP